MSYKNKATTVEKIVLFLVFLVFAIIVVGVATRWGGVKGALSDSDIKFQFVTSSKTAVIPQSDIEDDANANKKININTATVEQLDALPGIGEKKAEVIIKYREANGPFKRIEDILNVSGIGEKNFQEFKDLIIIK